MKSDFIAVTDHIKDFSIEREILGKFFEDTISKKTTIILVWHKEINEKFLRNYPSIRAIVRYGVGYDNIDLDFCKKKNIIVANTPDYGVDEVADSALAMILYLTRKIGKLENLAKNDSRYWIGKDINQNMRRLNKLNLGIIGLGRIGGSIAKKFLPFSRNIGFYDPYIPNGYEKVYGIKKFNSLSELLKDSDIVSINTPLTQETEGLVNEEFLNSMKKGSYLINLSRGPIVKNNDLIFKKLICNHLEGYGTDVWTNEPPLKNDEFYKYLIEQSNDLTGRVIINPHTAYYSFEASHECRSKACSTCLDIIHDRIINTRVI